MSQNKNLFLKILKAELEDLEDDLARLIHATKDRHDKEEITDYVFMENTALIKSEISSIRIILENMDCCQDDQYESLEDLHKALTEFLQQETQDFAFPRVVYDLAKKKLDKVLVYFQNQ